MDVRHLGQVQTFAADKLRKHNLFQTERFFLDVYCLEPGQGQGAHAHPGSDKVYLVLEGTCRFTVGDAHEEHGPGAAVLCPAGATHGVENAGSVRARLLVMMAPNPGKG